MNQVLNNLYIGGVYDFLAPLPDELTTICKLYNGKHGKYPGIPNHLKVLDHPCIDGQGWDLDFIGTTLEDIYNSINQGEVVAIMCAAGKSRSATMTLAYLCNYESMTLANALKYLKSKRPIIDPSLHLLASLVTYLSIHPYLSSLGVF